MTLRYLYVRRLIKIKRTLLLLILLQNRKTKSNETYLLMSPIVATKATKEKRPVTCLVPVLNQKQHWLSVIVTLTADLDKRRQAFETSVTGVCLTSHTRNT